MKNTLTFLFLVAITLNCNAQDKKSEEPTIKIRCGTTLKNNGNPLFVLDGVLIDKATLADVNPKDIISFTVVKGNDATNLYGATAIGGAVLLQTKKTESVKCKTKTYPFKLYCLENNNWVTQQDIYNALEGRVPSLRVGNRNAIAMAPVFSIRGDTNTIVIVDGIRYDASILNAINPNDIESIKVAPSAAANNFLRNGLNY